MTCKRCNDTGIVSALYLWDKFSNTYCACDAGRSILHRDTAREVRKEQEGKEENRVNK